MSIHTVDHLYQTGIPPGYDGPATSMFKMRGDGLLHYINCSTTTCGECDSRGLYNCCPTCGSQLLFDIPGEEDII